MVHTSLVGTMFASFKIKFLLLLQPKTAPTPPEFYEKYVKPSKAAIFRNAMKNTPAFKLWTDRYLKENYGELEVRLEGKKEKVCVISPKKPDWG